MVNLYRFCIAILFASLSFAFAQNCRIELVPDKNVKPALWTSHSNGSYPICSDLPSSASGFTNCVSDFGIEDNGDDTYSRTRIVRYKNGTGEKKQVEPRKTAYPLIEKEICIDPKPDLSGWENCKSGKDHGFSWIIIGDGNGEGESRFKQEFWACDDPDFWEVYNHPPEPMPTDPDKPTDPTDPKDPNKPTDPNGEGGEGGDSGSGSGNDGGSEGGSDNGSENGGNQNGTSEGLTQGEVQEAIEGALDSKGKDLEGKINKWWLVTQGDLDKAGKTMGHDADSIFNNEFASLVSERNMNDFEREYRFQFPASKQCPAPIPIKIDFLGIDIQFEFTLICEFIEMLGLLVLASAYMSAIYIIMGLRKA